MPGPGVEPGWAEAQRILRAEPTTDVTDASSETSAPVAGETDSAHTESDKDRPLVWAQFRHNPAIVPRGGSKRSVQLIRIAIAWLANGLSRRACAKSVSASMPSQRQGYRYSDLIRPQDDLLVGVVAGPNFWTRALPVSAT